MESKPYDVIVVGAGLIGAGVAAMLRRNGHKVDVYEQSEFTRELGAGISIAPNCSKVMNSLFPELNWDNLGCVAAQNSILHSCDGNTKKKIEFNYHEEHGSGLYYSHRVDLHNELMRLAFDKASHPSEPAQLHLGDAVISCDFEGGVITVASGKTHKADLIIGADGIRSTIRQLMIGKEYDAKPSKLAAYRWIVDGSQVKEDADLEWVFEADGATMLRDDGDGPFVVCYPCRNKTLVNVAGIHIDQRDQDAFAWNIDVDHATILEKYAHLHPKFQKLFQLGSTPRIWQIRQLAPLPTWTKGRCIILGDAAHAMFPTWAQGFAMGIEDIAALSIICPGSTPPSEIPNRLKIVEGLRKERVETVRKLSEANAPGYFNPEGLTDNRFAKDDIVRYDAISEARKVVEQEGLGAAKN